MSRAKSLETPMAWPRSVAQGRWIAAGLVGAALIAMVFILPRLAAVGALTGEGNFIIGSLAIYLVSTALYVVHFLFGWWRLNTWARAITVLGFALHTLGLGIRWALAGHPPFSNLYEMLLSFAWGVVAFQVALQARPGFQFLGALTLPVAVLSIILALVLPSTVRPLMPALQSTWLHIHVSLAVLSYAGFALSFGAAVLFLIKDGVRRLTFLKWTAALLAGIYGAMVLTYMDPGGTLWLPAWDAEHHQKIWVARDQALMVPVPGAAWPLVVVGALALVALGLAFLGKEDEVGAERRANRVLLAALAAQSLALVVMLVKVNGEAYPVPGYEGRWPVALSSFPFALVGIVLGLFMTLAWLSFAWKYEAVLKLLPSHETLDALTYRVIALCFPLLTLMIITGAFWANRAWGTYWSWDPKEDWALVTWVTYAGYLHARLTRGWRGRRSAYLAILGFAIVVFTFLGVSFLLPGLHSYA